MFDPKETEVQIALGSYKVFWISLSAGNLYDPDWLKDVIEKHLPRSELWTQGNHKVWGTIEHLAALSYEFSQREPRVTMGVSLVNDGKFQKVKL